jgi:hypothetical protein
MQNLIESELAEMPSCNLAEIKDNAWLQESGNRGNDLYIANVDDFIRALIQVSRYYQFLKAEEFCTWEPHFEGEEVFDSQKCKADIPLGSEHESHRPD